MAHDCKDCEGTRRFGLTRRDMLRGSLGGFLGFAFARQTETFGAAMPDLLLPQDTTTKSAKSVIVVWLGGGPSTLDLWDPKEGRDTGGPTKAIETSVKGIQFADNLPTLAKEAQHLSVIRGMVSREGSHERGRYLLHTGYVPTGTVVHPSMGSISAMELGNKKLDLPNFISLGGSTDGAGFLPPEFNPFAVDAGGGRPGGGGGKGPAAPASDVVKISNVSYPNGVDKNRFRERMKFLQEQEADFEKEHASEEVTRHKTAYEKADRLMHTPLLEAFDLGKEKPELVKSYGEGKFGRSCMLARRLIERGVAFVEISLGGWDTHQDNFTKVASNCKQLDPGLGTLIRDLHDKRMLDRTLVVCMGEFGRTPKINDKQGRDHYPRAWSMMLAGGGVQGGRVIGSTDKDGVEVKERPVTVPDLFATVYSALGVDPKKKNISPLGRPIALSDNGVPVKELLS
jgi:hypothetical protein